MSQIFNNKINQFLYNNFKNQSNIENIVNKNINDGNILYEDLNNKFGEVSNMSDSDVEKVNIKLQQLKNNKNRVSNVINTSITQINNVNNIIKTISTIITLSQTIIKILKSLPIPARYLTSGMIVTFSDRVQKADRKIEKLDEIIKNTLPFIAKLLEILNKIQQLLIALDYIIGLIEAFLSLRNKKFAQNAQISPSSPQISLPNSNVIGLYNGFTFELRKENNPQFQIGEIKRNYAIAIDSKGIERIKSQASFASDPQILIDELRFIIERDNLKA